MKVKDFMKQHEGEYVHLHWEGYNPRTKCVGMDAYSTNQNLAETYGELEILEWRYTKEMHYDKDWNHVPMDVTLCILASDE